MLDKERILGEVDELNSYLRELQIATSQLGDFEEFKRFIQKAIAKAI